MSTQDGPSPPWLEEDRRGEGRRGGERPDTVADEVADEAQIGVARAGARTEDTEDGDAAQRSDGEDPDVISSDR